MIPTFRSATVTMLLLVAAAWTAGCELRPAEPTPHTSTESTPAPSPTVAPSATPTPSPTSIPSPTVVPSPTPTPSPTVVPATPTPSSWRPQRLPSYAESSDPCGPDLSPYRGGIYGQFLHWTKDNSGVVFDLGYATWVVDAEGATVRKIVDADPESHLGRGQYGYYADVSPDGSRIVYSTCEYTYYDHDAVGWRYNLGYDLAAVNVDGSDLQRLTDNLHFENYPVWSPDGTRIAFIAHNDYSRRADYDYILSPNPPKEGLGDSP